MTLHTPPYFVVVVHPVAIVRDVDIGEGGRQEWFLAPHLLHKTSSIRRGPSFLHSPLVGLPACIAMTVQYRLPGNCLQACIHAHTHKCTKIHIHSSHPYTHTLATLTPSTCCVAKRFFSQFPGNHSRYSRPTNGEFKHVTFSQQCVCVCVCVRAPHAHECLWSVV